MRLKDKVAIVTRAGRGLGKAIALALGREGSRVVVVDINPAQGDVLPFIMNRARDSTART